jgi:hypothetical protein
MPLGWPSGSVKSGPHSAVRTCHMPPTLSRTTLIAVPLAAFLFLAAPVVAQQPDPTQGGIPQPPSTIAGSITDAAGPVPAGLPVEAVIGNKVCGTSETVYTGEGDARVTVYVVDVVSETQIPDCGRDGVAVRIRVGDRLSEKPVVWDQGLVLFDITFGDVTPAPIPTFTPTTPPTATNTPQPGATQPPTEASPGTGTPGSGGTGGDNLTPTTTGTAASSNGTRTATASATGGLSSATPGAPNSGDGDNGGGGVPMWAIVLLALGGIAAVGGGVGYMMSRSSSAPGDEEPAP